MPDIARRYYPNAVEGVSLPCAIGHGLTLNDPLQLLPFGGKGLDIGDNFLACLSFEGAEVGKGFSWFLAFENAIHFHSSASFHESYTISRGGFEHKDAGSIGGWADRPRGAITESSLHFASRVIADLEAVMLPETFSRVANAIRLYDAAQFSMQPDFALLGFIGCLESLFSVATQELSFRLCLTISKFSRDTIADQRSHFAELKRLYKIRSKIAHGDKLAFSEESAAIQLVEHWVPTAARVCRNAIFRLLDLSLVSVFNSKEKHEELLEQILFHPDIAAALEANQNVTVR